MEAGAAVQGAAPASTPFRVGAELGPGTFPAPHSASPACCSLGAGSLSTGVVETTGCPTARRSRTPSHGDDAVLQAGVEVLWQPRLADELVRPVVATETIPGGHHPLRPGGGKQQLALQI